MKIKDVLKGSWEKYPKPILTPGSYGEWDDILTGTPRVIKKSQDEYFLFFTGQNHKTGIWAIGLAKSNNLLTWKKFSKNPILIGTKNSWDERIDGVYILKNNKKYYLFYEASNSWTITQNILVSLLPLSWRQSLGKIYRRFNSFSLGIEHAKGRKIGLAFSKDLLKWVKYQNNPVLKPEKTGWDSDGVYAPSIIKINKKFYLFYAGSDGKKIQSGMAISRNMVDWEKYAENPILKNGFSGSWDERVVTVSSIIKIVDGYCLFYEGEDRENIYRIGMVYSYDLKTWIKNPKNPIISIGKRGSFDERMVCAPYAFLNGENLYIFYTGQDRNMRGHIGLASLKYR